jgi:hypothetical protein
MENELLLPHESESFHDFLLDQKIILLEQKFTLNDFESDQLKTDDELL